MVCSFLITLPPSQSGQSHSLLRLLISMFIDKNVSSISQGVVVIRYLQQCIVLNVFQNRFSSGDVCMASIRLTHTEMPEIQRIDNSQVQSDLERKTTSCSQDERFARESFAV